MKKTVLIMASSLVLYACGGGKAAEEKKEVATKTEDPALTAGLDLIAKSGCPTCHKIDDASTGPAYRNVAEKYPNTSENIAILSSKIIKGGSGNWGTIPMTPHPDISPENAASMVTYILSLKK